MYTAARLKICSPISRNASKLYICTFLDFQENFKNPGYSMLKTSVMMIGELDFDNLFFDNPNDHPSMLPYRIFAMVFFLLFLIVMPILIMNLLVRLHFFHLTFRSVFFKYLPTY